VLYTPMVGMYFCAEASLFCKKRPAHWRGSKLKRATVCLFFFIQTSGFNVRRYRARSERDLSCSVGAGRAPARHGAAGRGLSRQVTVTRDQRSGALAISLSEWIKFGYTIQIC
jgi:hypothetical protein